MNTSIRSPISYDLSNAALYTSKFAISKKMHGCPGDRHDVTCSSVDVNTRWSLHNL